MECPAECGPIYTKASPVMQLNWANNWISGSKSFSVYPLLKVHNRGKVHQYSICDC